MLFLLIIATLLSLGSLWLSHSFAWSHTTLTLALCGIGAWTSLRLVWHAIADLRHVRYALDYAQQRRTYDAPLPAWVREGRRDALLLAVVASVFGVVLGALAGWLVAGAALAARLALLLGLSYAAPALLLARHLARFTADTRRFVAERREDPPQA